MTNSLDEFESILNPDLVRTKLISAGLFLVGHEMLIDTIKRHLLSFFATEWNVKGPVPGTRYACEVLDRDPRGKSDALRGSIAWLRMMGVIDSDDEEMIRTLTDTRNELAHEMTSMMSGARPPQFILHFEALMQLVQKIEKWWIVNVEIGTNPDYDGQEIDEEGIVSGPALVMHLLGQVALGEGEAAWDLHREFVAQRKETKQ